MSMEQGTITPPTDEKLLAGLNWLQQMIQNGLEDEDRTPFSVVFHLVHDEAVRRGLRQPAREWRFETKEEMIDFLRNPPPEVRA